jgi:hypothetical protein
MDRIYCLKSSVGLPSASYGAITPKGILMKKMVEAVIAAALTLGCHSRGLADGPAEAREIVERAIRAAGGSARLARTQIMTRTAKGTMFFFNQQIPFSTQLTIAFPDRLRDRIDIRADKSSLVVRVISRDKGWQASAGSTTEMTSFDLNELKEEIHALWLTTLVPLAGKNFTMTVLPETILDNRPLAGIEVHGAGHGDVSLYFDKQSYWLAKMVRRGREAGMAVSKEYLFADPREWAGVRLPMKQTELVNGKKSVELAITSYEFLDRVDDNTFAKP